MLSKFLVEKISNETVQKNFSISNGNNNTLPLKILTYSKLYLQN